LARLEIRNSRTSFLVSTSRSLRAVRRGRETLAAPLSAKTQHELVLARFRDATVLDHRTGEHERIDASYVIGADGAHSTVRACLGIEMDGPDELAEYHRVEFRAPLHDVVGDRHYGLYVVTHPDAASVVARRGAGDRWGLSTEWRPGQPRLVDQDDAEIVRLVATAAGVADLRPHVERRSAFSFAAQIADRYQEGCGFLVGDAAHRMTPRGGTGMNTAIQDAYDLGWKLGWVVRGWAGPELLASYEAERRPVGLHNVERAGSPDGARRDAQDALPWDLNGRVAHHWVRRGGQTVPTLDLLGDGLTLLAAPGPSPPRPASSAPVVTHVLDEATARALDLAPGHALLLRPDGRVA
jgi:putative polyketide hydroxylase